MPFGDGTGLMGLGPMAGRRGGFCAGFGRPVFASPMPGYPYRYGYAGLAPVWPRWGWGFGRGWGRGFGRGWRRWGFGFRGSSPPWPYVGLGRGGLPRCGYFLGRAAAMSVPPAYLSYGSPGAMPYYGGMAYPGAMPYGYAGAPMGVVPGADPYAPQMTREQELDFLKSQAEVIKSQLEQIAARIKELETE